MSISEIAKKAGVSPATVSRVLNNPDYRCADLKKRDKIWKIAMEMNYVPNEAARNLKRGNTGTNQVYYMQVIVTRTERSQADPFFTELLRIVESEIHNYSCILSQVWYVSEFSSDRQCKSMNLDKKVAELYEETEGKSNGVIVIGRCNKEAIRKIKQYFKNVVAVNRNSTNREVDEVICDGRKIVAIAVEHLIELGHTEIGYVGECLGEARYKGFTDALTRHNIEPYVNYIYDVKHTEAAGYDTMLKILESDEIPTAIYCASDITAVGMLKALGEKRKYHNISIISSDNIEQSQYTKPMLTTVSLPKEEMGRFAVYLLLDRIKGGHKSVVSMELEGTLIKRDSCYDLFNSSWGAYI